MFKIKKVEEMKTKLQQAKFFAIMFGVIFVCMILNIIYLNIKISNLEDNLS
jgi:hypothetical protein